MKEKRFDLPERDVMLAETRMASELRFLPSLNVLGKSWTRARIWYLWFSRSKAKKKKKNFVELSKAKPNHFGCTKQKSDETINDYLTKFLLGMEIKRERGGE